MEQLPTIGRIVWYQAHGSPNGQHKSVPRAAIVTDAGVVDARGEWDSMNVSLCVLNPTGMFFNQGCKYDPNAGPGTWRWPERK
jgi:hypothetical protein